MSRFLAAADTRREHVHYWLTLSRLNDQLQINWPKNSANFDHFILPPSFLTVCTFQQSLLRNFPKPPLIIGLIVKEMLHVVPLLHVCICQIHKAL